MEKLEPGKCYHIYNRGINSCNIFNQEEHYIHFMELYEKFILPIADTYAWVLMPNHFHFMVRIKENIQYKYSRNDRSINPAKFKEIKWETIPLTTANNTDKRKIPEAHLHFSHLFNAYAMYFNNKNSRHGPLFERPFKRKLIDDERYFQQLILYIHNNPVHHGFCDHPIEYGWSSYLTCVSDLTTKLKREETLEFFQNKENFIFMHNKEINIKPIEEWLEI